MLTGMAIHQIEVIIEIVRSDGNGAEKIEATRANRPFDLGELIQEEAKRDKDRCEFHLGQFELGVEAA